MNWAANGVLAEALRGLNLYLQLKNKRLYYDIRRDSLKRQAELKHEIEYLRGLGLPEHVERCDLLRSEFIAERAELEHLSAAYSRVTNGDADSDEERDVFASD